MDSHCDVQIPRVISRLFTHPAEVDALRQAWPALQSQGWSARQFKTYLKALRSQPESYREHPLLADLAQILMQQRPSYVEPVDLPDWFDRSPWRGGIPEARRLPISVHGAVLPGRQAGLGLPVGAALATRGAVIPRAVGRDLGCRVHLSVFPQASLKMLRESGLSTLRRAVRPWIQFGLEHHLPHLSEDAIFDDTAWSTSRVLLRARDRARQRFGSSGTGNHFVDFGTVRLTERVAPELPESGTFVGLLTHHGSRGLGADVTAYFHNAARRQRTDLPRELRDWAWLDLETEEGQEYWLAMELCQRYTEASHRWLHKTLAAALDLGPSWEHTSPHNFASLEDWRGETVVVHRKGTIRLGPDEFGVVCGTQTDPTHLVRGAECDDALFSASHGLAREMSRGTARSAYRRRATDEVFREAQVQVVSHQADEWPGVYQDQAAALAAHAGLISPVGTFHPSLVWMCGINDPSED